MHHPTLSTLITNFKEAHFRYEEEFAEHFRDSQRTTFLRPSVPPPSPKYVLIMAQHLHDRSYPWNLNLVLLAHLFNHGIHVITLHDNLAPQQERASAHGTHSKPTSKFGRYRHDYEWLIPSLKFFSPSTLLSRSLRPLHYQELESWEGAISSQYSSDLQDLLYAFLSLWGAPPLPTFAATPQPLGLTLIHGVHRWPDTVESYFHLDRAPHDTPLTYYTRVFLHQLRFPALRALGLPEADVLAIEHSTRSALLNLPLLQALDFLHTQLLAGLCVAAPQRGLITRDHILDPTRRHPPPNFGRLTPPREALQQFQPPKFRCWIGKRISPNMSLITLKCDSSPWANRFTQGSRGNHSAGFAAGNLLQLVFPTVPPPPPSDPNLPSQDAPPYSSSSAFSDRSPAYVKELSGIPILLKYNQFSTTTAQGPPLGHLKLHHMMAPDSSTLLELPQLPPLLHSQSFYCPVSAIRSFFSKITSLPLYRTPKTLGWPTKDSALAPPSPKDTASPAFSNLFHILQLLPNFFPTEVRGLISDFKIEESSGLSFFYSFEAFTHLKQLGIRPGTSSTDMSHPYEWPLDWDLNGFTSILEPRSFLAPLLSTHSEILALLLDLGLHFTRALTASLLAPNGHFPGLLLATLTGLQAGHTTLCVQGIFGSGKTYSASLLLVVLSSILNVNCVLTAEPNLPLATAIEIIPYWSPPTVLSSIPLLLKTTSSGSSHVTTSPPPVVGLTT